MGIATILMWIYLFILSFAFIGALLAERVK